MSKGEEGVVKLIGAWASPFVMRAHIALNIKSVKYELLEETLGSKSQILLESNPVHKKIPVLIHGDKAICESLIIVEYVDEAWASGPSILPSQPYDRALARFWANYVDEKWFPAMKSIAGARGEEERKNVIQQLEEGLGLLENAYKTISEGKPFFGGDRIGYLDIALGCFLGWLRVTEISHGLKLLDHSKTPLLAQWAQRFCADDTVKNVMPETEKLLEFAKIIRAKLAVASASN